MVHPVNKATVIKQPAIDYEKELNPAQLEAVTYTDGPLLVIAGAGSGKTRTLTYRVARLVEAGVRPGSILLMTFTRRASQEMLKRASLLLDNRCEEVSGGTFHAFAHNVLRRHASLLGFTSNFAILDRVDSENLIGMLRKELGPVAKQRAFPRKQTLTTIFSRAANKRLSIEDVLANEYPHFKLFMEEIVALSHDYQKSKTDHQFLDYDDLLLFLLKLLKGHPDVRERVALAYQYFMVDEYQDTNRVQAEILHLLASIRNNVMVVGDDSQSIYAFRGADYRNIIEFPEQFPGTKIVRLEQNYRSVQPILNLTNIIIEKAEEKYTKTLFTRQIGGALPVLAAAESENAQSRFVVEKIREFNRNGVPLDQMAVLFRAGFNSFDLEIELVRDEIPFIKVGGFKFMESAHIKDVLAHLRAISNPNDRISWHRVLLLVEKIGPRTAQNIYDAVLAEKSGYTGLLALKPTSSRSPGMENLKELFRRIDSKPMSVSEMGEAVLEYYLPILESSFDDHPKRKRDLEHLVTIMRRYTTLPRFLSDMALEPPNTSVDGTFSEAQKDSQRLTLSTVHSAKGLEWHTVFIIWALDGRFPSLRALNDPEEFQEELRLMYVAATRAKENLFIVYPEYVWDRASGMVLSKPSCFVDGIGEDVLERWVVED